MQQQTHFVSPKTLPGYIRCIAGLFITKENPNGLTLVELKFLSSLVHILLTNNKETIDKEVKLELANVNNMGLQVVLNYLTRLRKKGVLINNELHPVFTTTKTIIEWKNVS